LILLYTEKLSVFSNGSGGIFPWWHPLDVSTPTPGLLFAGWYLQEVAARNCRGDTRYVAVVVEVIQNHESGVVVLLQLVQWVLHLRWYWNWKKTNQTSIHSVYLTAKSED
jgi:hypothetical protein